MTQSHLHFQKLLLTKDWRMESRSQEKQGSQEEGHCRSPRVTWTRDLALAVRMNDQQEGTGVDTGELRMPPRFLVEQLRRGRKSSFEDKI